MKIKYICFIIKSSFKYRESFSENVRKVMNIHKREIERETGREKERQKERQEEI